MELTKEKICQCDLYYERSILWDQTQSNYKNNFKKNDTWSKISEVMGVDKAEIEKKMKNLIGQFYHECKRMKSGVILLKLCKQQQQQQQQQQRSHCHSRTTFW
jgi:hypothetical protein